MTDPPHDKNEGKRRKREVKKKKKGLMRDPG